MNESRSRLSNLSQKEKAQLLEKLRERKQRPAPAGGWIAPRDHAADPPPLSFAQQRLWFLDRLAPGDPAYNIALPVRLDGPLDTAALRRALSGVVARHEALRTTFGAAGPAPVQVIAPEGGCELPLIDLSGLGEPAREEAERLADLEGVLPFDLGTGPLLRAALVRLSPGRHLLCLTLHHIVSDGWSMEVLIREVAALYQGRELPPLPIQYADYAVWQRQWLSGEVLERPLAHWRERLAGLPAALDLPTDRPRPPVRSTAGGLVPLQLDAPTGERLRALARDLSATPFMILLAAFLALLQRLTSQDDLAVGSPVANRDRPETADLIGFFVNTLVLRGDLSGEPTFREVVERLRLRALDAFTHQDLPFERLVEELRPERDPSRSPLVQVSFTLQTGMIEEAPPLGDVLVDPLPAAGGTVRFDLTLNLRPNLAGSLLYGTALFDAATAQRMAEGFVRLATAAIAAPDRPLSGLPLLSEGEQTQLLQENNDTRAEGDAPLLGDLFAAWAERTPGAIAVDAGERTVTYGELAEQSSRLAGDLRRLGVGPETIVGLQADRSPELVLGILAIWKVGGAYLPLDPSLPAERRSWMLADAGAGVLLVEPGTEAPAFAGAVLALEAPSLPSLKSLPSFNPDTLAYLIYTSGSTGRPKGVLVPHRGLANLAAQMHRFAAGPGSRVLLFASPGFDASLLDLALAFSSGATLSVAPGRELPGLGRLLRERRITHLHLPPSALASLGDEGPPPGLECVILGGEPVPEPLAARWGDGRRLFNDYGPTESTVFVTADERREGRHTPLTIGRPIDNVEAHLLDRNLRPVPLGVPGEVCLGGAGLARGYLRLPDLTAERFVPNPFVGPGERLYRTGDLARRLPDGRIDFLGRIDHQVKVRGFRIEPGEIEAALRRHSAVREAVVVPRGEGAERSLTAWVVASEEISGEALRAFLRETLPAYLVPASIGLLDRLPLTPNGKVDRRDLARRAPELRPAAAGAPPRTELERTLAAIWMELLNVERVGRDDSFFDLGGHSLLLARLQGELYERLGREVPLLALFEHPTIGSLAVYLEKELEGKAGAAEPVTGSRDREQRRRESLERQRNRLAGRRAAS